jgi:hypothetical protein
MLQGIAINPNTPLSGSKAFIQRGYYQSSWAVAATALRRMLEKIGCVATEKSILSRCLRITYGREKCVMYKKPVNSQPHLLLLLYRSWGAHLPRNLIIDS